MCNSRHAFLSQFFGYQVEDSGTVAAAAAVSNAHTVPVYTPTNPLQFENEMGHNGYRYGLDVRAVLSPYFRPGYMGSLPLSQNPRIDAPQPFDVPVY